MATPRWVLDTVAAIKKQWPELQVIGGNIVTGEAAQALVKAGADAREGGHRPRLHLHHAHRRRCRRAADQRGGHGREGAGRHRRLADRRRRHPLLRRHRQGTLRRRALP